MKLKKLISKYKSKKSELSDLKYDWIKEKNELMNDIDILTKELKLKQKIISKFIPKEYEDKINDHCHYNDEDDTWQIEYIELTGSSSYITKYKCIINYNYFR